MNSNPEHKQPITEERGARQDGLWDIRDLSGYLKVKIKTIYALVPDIPHYRIGKLIRFQKAEIDVWLESKRKYDQVAIRGPKMIKKKIDNIDALIRKTIDQMKEDGYNPDHGKSDRIKAQGKEF
jgi:excisionase family DNA binding protein